MHAIAWSILAASTRPTWPALWLLLVIAAWATRGHGMAEDQAATLRADTRDLFYHGYNNYLAHAFPEDELKPISCLPQVRNRENPADIGLNDVLGNYSVTLVDSLSTLAILASDADPTHRTHALSEFQAGVRALVGLYGDGTEKGRCGSRACGFDLDSKVQVFETNIRGVGGLLSAHLFAVGELPIRGYQPVWSVDQRGHRSIDWNDFAYDGQLLRLAHDLASRLLPAFSTGTGLPYPRVNLRHGIPFYQEADNDMCRLDGTSSHPREITETCAAGAGSLVLEFTTLSRLTGDRRFEELAKRAFWAVWERRSAIGLIGAGIDAESGQWTLPPLSGIGAGIDSFFEYAMKSYVLLSGLPYNTSDPNADLLHAPEGFLRAWQHAHAAVKRHIHRSASTERHPYYAQSDLITGAPRYSWIDNLSAYYPGLLTLAGELEEAIESHLVFAALWTRYKALPERWHAFNSFIDPNFKHWAGRPEFIESTYYLYHATKDPWYLHVGEMTIRDIRRRCWTKCGWADLGDVISGEQRDRMESFFLGETAKYLYLLFTEDHPLNTLDAPFVFSTEGHPLVIPPAVRQTANLEQKAMRRHAEQQKQAIPDAETCPAPPAPLPLTFSSAANRGDLFHAAALAQLHLVPANPTRSSPLVEASENGPAISLEDVRSPTNYSFYPWTLPQSLIPPQGTSTPIKNAMISTLTFPNLNPKNSEAENGIIPLGALQKVLDGVVINSLSNIRLNMVQEPRNLLLPSGDGMMIEIPEAGGQEYRIQGIANWVLGRDEKVLLSSDALHGVSPVDPHFTRIKDLEMVDLVLDVPIEVDGHADDDMVVGEWEVEIPENSTVDSLLSEIESIFSGLLIGSPSKMQLDHSTIKPVGTNPASLRRQLIPAILPTGLGAAPLPAAMETSADPASLPAGQLPFRSIFFLDSELCSQRLPANIARDYSVLVLKRGECAFGDKLANIPSFAPSSTSLQLVIVLSVPESKGETEQLNAEGELIRPLLDQPQKSSNGFDRRHPIAMVMVDGSAESVEALRRTASAVGVFNAHGDLVDRKRPDGEDADVSRPVRPGLGVKRRYWFESMGVPIVNLNML